MQFIAFNHNHLIEATTALFPSVFRIISLGQVLWFSVPTDYIGWIEALKSGRFR